MPLGFFGMRREINGTGLPNFAPSILEEIILDSGTLVDDCIIVVFILPGSTIRSLPFYMMTKLEMKTIFSPPVSLCVGICHPIDRDQAMVDIILALYILWQHGG